MSDPLPPEGRLPSRRELRAMRAREAAEWDAAADEAVSAASTGSRPSAGPAPAPGPQAATETGAQPVRDRGAVLERTAPETFVTSGGSRLEPAGSNTDHAGLHDLLESGPSATVRGPKRRRRGAIIIILIILALIAALVFGGWWAAKQVGGPIGEFFGVNAEPADYEEGLATGEAVIVIEQGDTGWEVSQKLHEQGVTMTESVFYDMLVSAQQNPDLRPGVYQLQQKMTASAALTTLEDPDSRLPGVAYPEGFTVSQVVPILASGLEISEDEVTAALEDPSDYGVEANSLEGWLFPASYEFTPGTDVTDAVQRMVDRTRQSLADAGVPEGDEQQILTAASVIQREAAAEDDFFKVSRVIENRIDDDMLLQMDSTAQYGVGRMHDGDVFSSAEALEDDNPWNTYVHKGLPAGPIANPGDLAIQAAMTPADGDWLYFATVNLDTGETRFAATLDEHEKNVEVLHAWCDDNPDSTGCGG
ncbi:MAG TPA: endolytic transglycosylase MltG [Candidatus Microbacterium stercoravium]|uniref:Endolytic murein transglycosylase n=1 Tax=Candidatus Microbacterium stercoravium TaxID=2838697 RepID=A0A9D2H426_9MICO|nr:endolytic transglycosylase MltG [Candidatus Microbacterium stercoravium]